MKFWESSEGGEILESIERRYRRLIGVALEPYNIYSQASKKTKHLFSMA